VGSVLLQQLLAEAKSMHLPVRLRVRDDNYAAIRFYRRLGFASTNTYAGYLSMECMT
jgi:ribosomal protein S18 acetylase RimI-like enzyme